MYVIPQTVVKFYRDIPWNNDYKHTIWFTNVNAQNTFFASKLAYTFNDFTYVRQSGVIRVPHIADDLYNCNYISFLNAGYGNKTFYAFITKVEYVNNETTHIHFELDYIQTWLFDITVEQCFVEREHVSDDTVGLHTVDEKLETGEYIIEDTRKLNYNKGAMFITETATTPTEAEWVNNILNMCDIYAGDVNSIGSILADIFPTVIKDYPERLVSFRMIVSEMLDTEISGYKNNVHEFNDTWGFTRNTNITFHNSCEGQTYVPKNNKLKCYPYCCFTIDNFCGDVVQFHWEEFVNAFSCNFKVRGIPFPVPVLECFPSDYKARYSNPTSVDHKQFKVIYDNFPEIPMATDTFKIWCTSQFKKDIASEGASILTGSVATASLIGAGLLTENPLLLASGIGGAVGTALNNGKKGYDIGVDYQYHKLHDTTLTGSLGNAGTTWGDNEVGFRYTSYQIKAEYAKMIDNFLTRFGYKVNIYKVPELTSRRYFNYVKTLDASVRGNIPTDCQKLIASIFDSGITLWHTSDVGNYNVDNAIVG